MDGNARLERFRNEFSRPDLARLDLQRTRATELPPRLPENCACAGGHQQPRSGFGNLSARSSSAIAARVTLLLLTGGRSGGTLSGLLFPTESANARNRRRSDRRPPSVRNGIVRSERRRRPQPRNRISIE